MADHSKPLITSTYANFVSELDGRFDDLTLGLDPAVTSPTNLPTGAIRWNSASYKWEKWSGSAWADLSPYYNINLSGPLSLTANSASDALRITQTGAGNALVVEDSANPDSTPFVVSGTGDVGIGISSPTEKLDILGNFKLSGSATLSGGTANGVAYLNGSKVLTTGSALTFDGTNLAVGYGVNDKSISVGGAGGYGSYQLNGGNSTGYLFGSFAGFGDGVHLGYNFYKNAAGTSIIPNSSGSTSLITTSYGFVSFSTGATNSAPTEQMRLTSTGLGIGTSSPGAKLDINKGSAGIVARFGGGGTSGILYSDATFCAIADSNGANGINIYGASNYLSFNTNSSEKMRLDSSGNLGLGVTPSAWSIPAIQSQYGTLSGTAQAQLSANYYYNSGDKYYGNGLATIYTQSSGLHKWYIAPNNTSGGGAVMSLTQAMTLDASGNLGITPINNSNIANTLKMGFAGYGWMGSIGTFNISGDTGGLLFSTANAGTLTERMRIDYNGNVGIGTSSPNAGLFVAKQAASVTSSIIGVGIGSSPSTASIELFGSTSGAALIDFAPANGSTDFSGRIFYDLPSNYMSFATNATERMRIDSSGNVGIGTSSPSARLTLKTASVGTLLNTDDGTVIGIIADTTGSVLTYGTYTLHPVSFKTGNTEHMRIDSGGVLYKYQPAHTGKTGAATLTGAELLTGILVTAGGSYTITLPTGTDIDSAISPSLNVNGSFDWSIINQGTGTITIAANGNNTIGYLTVARDVSARFRFRKTAANTYTVYKIA